MIYLVNWKPEMRRRNNNREYHWFICISWNVSRKMEIISNIYQTIILSFEKISDGKYISESTLNLFKRNSFGWQSDKKGDDYFGYKDILKSIENIWILSLTRKQRLNYTKRQQRKAGDRKMIDKRFPDDRRKKNCQTIRQRSNGRESEHICKHFRRECRILKHWEIFQWTLTILKIWWGFPKSLILKKTGQISEASYIFIKFLQNYRINPLTDEISLYSDT